MLVIANIPVYRTTMIFFTKKFIKPISGLVRLNLSARIRLNFRLARKAMKSPIMPSRQPPARKTDWPARLSPSKLRSNISSSAFCLSNFYLYTPHLPNPILRFLSPSLSSSQKRSMVEKTSASPLIKLWISHLRTMLSIPPPEKSY